MEINTEITPVEVWLRLNISELNDCLKYLEERCICQGEKIGWLSHTIIEYGGKSFIFTFNNEQDAVAFKLIKG